MTTAPATPTGVIGSYETPKKDRTQVFALDGHHLTVYRVKAAWFVDQAEQFGDLDEQDPAQVELLHETIRKVFRDPADRDYLYGRLRDEEDDFDYDDLGALLQVIRGKQGGGRPTGPSTSSSGRRSKTGGRSTARRR